jgi:hypothetical protein
VTESTKANHFHAGGFSGLANQNPPRRYFVVGSMMALSFPTLIGSHLDLSADRHSDPLHATGM